MIAGREVNFTTFPIRSTSCGRYPNTGAVEALDSPNWTTDFETVEVYNGQTDFWDCRTTWAFDAVEVTSSENKYVED